MKSVQSFTGCLVGLACGDALGGPVEEIPKHPSKTPRPVTEMVGGGFFNLKPGQITDDTEMALCLAESLSERQGFNIPDIAQRYQAWFADNPIGSGKTIEAAILRLNEGFSWREAGFSDAGTKSLGNGAVMRCAPLALVYHPSEPLLYLNTQAETQLTHPHPICVESSLFLNALISHLICEFESPHKDEVMKEAIEYGLSFVSIKSLNDLYRNTLENSKNTMGSVDKTIAKALNAVLSTKSFEEALLCSANGGGDADTIAAVTGAIAGTFYGENQIPARWKTKLIDRHEKPIYDRLIDLGESLFDLSGSVQKGWIK